MRPARLLCAAAAPILLGGCAAALVPVVAGGVVLKGQTIDRAHASPAPTVTETQPVAAPSLATAPEAAPSAVQPSSALAEATPAPANAKPRRKQRQAQSVALQELPQPPASPPATPAEAEPDDPIFAFARYAIGHGQPPPPGETRHSALIDPASLTGTPRLGTCGAQPPAVVIDLDPGRGKFNLDDAPLPAEGLADKLTAIREAGVTILWVASLPVTSAEKLYTILQASGLDPQRTDRLLLFRANDQHKQRRRNSAALDWCVIAIAGDRKGDFDEAFDYLRDPNGPVAQALEPNIGKGWFLIPQPID